MLGAFYLLYYIYGDTYFDGVSAFLRDFVFIFFLAFLVSGLGFYRNAGLAPVQTEVSTPTCQAGGPAPSIPFIPVDKEEGLGDDGDPGAAAPQDDYYSDDDLVILSFDNG